MINIKAVKFFDKFPVEHNVKIVPKSRTSLRTNKNYKTPHLCWSVIAFPGADFAVLEEVREGKGCPLHICCTDKQPNVPFGLWLTFWQQKASNSHPSTIRWDEQQSCTILHVGIQVKYIWVYSSEVIQITAQFLAPVSPFLLACLFFSPAISWYTVAILTVALLLENEWVYCSLGEMLCLSGVGSE